MIPVARPWLGEEEAAAAREAILSGWVTQGPRVVAFEGAFAERCGATHACAVSSCTTALHMALLAVGVRPGDVVVTVSHSFIATANAVRHCGAEPAFVDVEPETFNMSPEALERFLEEDCALRDGVLRHDFATRGGLPSESPLWACGGGRAGRVAAVLPVHQLGMPCDMTRILAIAGRFGLPVVEDAAGAAGSALSVDGGASFAPVGRPHGAAACFSFHPRKILTTGDGGMLTTADAALDAAFRLYRQHGMSVSDAVRHSARRVTIESYVTTGYNYRMTDIQAAVGVVQLGRLDDMIEGRRRLRALYEQALSGVGWLRLPCEPRHARWNVMSYPVRLMPDAPVGRDEFMQRLLDRGVASRPGVMNAHAEPPYRTGLRLPHSEDARERVVLLPMFNGMSEADVETVAREVRGVG
ncbi:dTDP-4-amino-4,6-dideoxygalactose transaminase [Desulfobaculum xiamenense]|uniref:dTDP-4-amino-4,6-dideoxygalactose transaminase n=1 Tax=Desulfobaculum xiamenense TaxID=995050 RepID=A0A846QPV8_9BACT|nr:DegT/DnrJ/EryC1/StrS family aminotransferase [Desulfobaculum xiamenense]NJB69217.1 dTDP-4-amino-4,6-dideoxygalactose transaminase [Desulfobaculum xiamenense]